MQAGHRTMARVIDFAAYRAGRQQPTLFGTSEPSERGYQSVLREPPPSPLSDRQLAHRRRMLAFLLTPR